MNKAIFLDRDGTLIEDKNYLNDAGQIHYLPDLLPALQLLRELGYLLFITTNQSGVSRGFVDLKNLHQIHQVMLEFFSKQGIFIQKIYFCPEVSDQAPCRKPNPGMLKQAAQEFDLNLLESWSVGDKLRDAECGLRAGGQGCLLVAPHESFALSSQRPLSEWEHGGEKKSEAPLHPSGSNSENASKPPLDARILRLRNLLDFALFLESNQTGASGIH